MILKWLPLSIVLDVFGGGGGGRGVVRGILRVPECSLMFLCSWKYHMPIVDKPTVEHCFNEITSNDKK